MNREQTRLEIGGDWLERADGWWLTVPAASIQQIARTMLKAEARFAAIVALPENENGIRISWHWDMAGTLLSVVSHLAAGMKAPSIADTYPGADWAEREAREYYAVEFDGRAETPPLMLRDTDRTGVLLCKTGERL
jgi:NADH:ubiquinone oxidoreductase subunit C